jgi:hypothetical protein
LTGEDYSPTYSPPGQFSKLNKKQGKGEIVISPARRIELTTGDVIEVFVDENLLNLN